MAEVVGFVASLSTLIETTFYVAKVLKDIKSGGNERKRLLAQIESLDTLLKRLSNDVPTPDREAEAYVDIVGSLKVKGGVFEQIDDVMSEIRTKVDRKRGWRGLAQPFTWPFEKEDVDRNDRQLQRLSLALSISIEEAALKVMLSTKEGVRNLTATTNKRELRAILEWMSPQNFLEQQVLEFEKHSQGTCDWFLKSDEFLAWKAAKFPLLYCSAIGGAGKTVLASVAVDDLRMTFSGQDVGFFVIYCKHDKPDAYTVPSLARTLIKQLVQMRSGIIPPELEKLLEEHYYTKDTKPDMRGIIDVLNANFPKYSKNYIVIDGLDEIIKDETRQTAIDFLLRLPGSPSIMCTSRPIDVIDNMFLSSVDRCPSSQPESGHDTLDPQSIASPTISEVRNKADDDLSFVADGSDLSYESELAYDSPSSDEYDEGSSSDLDEFGQSSQQDQESPPISRQSGSSQAMGEATNDNDICGKCTSALKSFHHSCTKCTTQDLVICDDCFTKDDRCLHHKDDYITRYMAVKMDVSARPRAIRTYVRSRISRSPELKKWAKRQDNFAKMVEDEVTYSAKKMFLLAQLHMDAISDPNLLKFSEVRSALLMLPKKLDDSYEQAMVRVQGHGRSLLRLVSFAARPLTTREVEHALGITRGLDELLDEEIIPIGTLVSKCAGLVVINEDGYVSFAHYTIVGYFGTHREELFGNGQADLAQRCLTYLNLKAFQYGPVTGESEALKYEARLREHPFLDYASLYWAHHAQESKDALIEDAAYKFITTEARRNASVQALWFSSDEDSANWRLRDGASALHVALFFKLRTFILRLLADGADISSRDPLGSTLLMWATQAGDVDVIKQILKLDVPFNASNREGATALHLAVSAGIQDVCQLLIDQKLVDVNVLDTTKLLTPLMLAIINEHSTIVKMLLARTDLQVNQKDPQGYTALHYAIHHGLDILQMLVKAPSIDINQKTAHGDTALILAMRKSDPAIAKCLLDARADVNVRQTALGGAGGNALMRAIDYDNVDIVAELLARHCDWTLVDTFQRGILHSGAINGSLRSLELVLRDIPTLDNNLQDWNGNTPMHDAVSDFPNVVRLLLQHNARIDLKNKRGMTVLDKAMSEGAMQSCKILQAHYAEQFGMPKRSMSGIPMANFSLLKAAQTGDERTVDRMIAEAKKDKSIRLDERDDWLERTVLQHAVHNEHVRIVRKLVAAGVDVDAKDRCGRSALHIAVLVHHAQLVRYLISVGAKVNTIDQWEESPLETCGNSDRRIAIYLIEHGASLKGIGNLTYLVFTAAIEGNIEACRRLIDAGAETQVKDDWGRSPYEVAKQSGHHKTARFLDRYRKGTMESSDLSGTPLPQDESLSDTKESVIVAPESSTLDIEMDKMKRNSVTKEKDVRQIDMNSSDGSPRTSILKVISLLFLLVSTLVYMLCKMVISFQAAEDEEMR